MTNNRRSATSADVRNEVQAKIKQYTEKDFPEANRIHELIMRANPSLCPRLWYGMPGYAKTKDSAVLCFFRKDTFISFGVTESIDIPSLGNGNIVPSAWYIMDLTNDVEQKIVDIVTEATK